jgi:hypothetical protein
MSTEKKYQDKLGQWVKLMHYIRFIYLEEQIEQRTYDEMVDCMLVFKEYALQDDDDTD